MRLRRRTQRLCAGDVDQPVAVRSSATTEDATDASFAGLQDTYLWVRGAGGDDPDVRSCWASLYSVESISYRRQRTFSRGKRGNGRRRADAWWTHDPQVSCSPAVRSLGDRSVITIEGAWGLGSAVVGGEVTPDRWVLGKITGEIQHARYLRQGHTAPATLRRRHRGRRGRRRSATPSLHE